MYYICILQARYIAGTSENVCQWNEYMTGFMKTVNNFAPNHLLNALWFHNSWRQPPSLAKEKKKQRKKSSKRQVTEWRKKRDWHSFLFWYYLLCLWCKENAWAGREFCNIVFMMVMVHCIIFSTQFCFAYKWRHSCACITNTRFRPAVVWTEQKNTLLRFQ